MPNTRRGIDVKESLYPDVLATLTLTVGANQFTMFSYTGWFWDNEHLPRDTIEQTLPDVNDVSMWIGI